MHLAVTRIDHEPLIVGLNNQLLQQRLPNPGVTPAAEATMRVLPASVGGWQITPWRTAAQNPNDRIEEFPVVLCHAAPNPLAPRQKRLKKRPRLIR